MANTLTQTTLSAACTVNQNTFTVASATNISAPLNGFFQKIYVIDPATMNGELMAVTAVNGTAITVSRLDQFKTKHVSGALVIINPVDPLFNAFLETDPPVVPDTTPALTWVINVVDGSQWLFSSVTSTWVPGFNNVTAPPAPTAAVASAAGAILPSGPLFHVTGTSAVTGFTAPNGFTSGSFTVIPDAVFTWTAAGNIALAGSAVVNKALTFIFDSNSAKWYPNYIA